MITKQEIDRIMKTEGKVKGAVFQTDAEYIKRNLGQEKLKKIKFFVSMKKLNQSAPEFWRRHWAAGKLAAGEFNEAGKYTTIIIKDLDLHPFFCKYEEGYLQRIAQYIVPSAKCQELKCTFRGGPHHEYRISWD